jgi:hypothetical protein
MKRIILFYIGLPLICLSSGYAFYFLNTVDVQVAENIGQRQQRRLIVNDPNNMKKQILIIESEYQPDSSKTVLGPKEEKAKKESGKGYLPNVELLKFFLQKGREGMPVLSIGNYLPFLK